MTGIGECFILGFRGLEIPSWLTRFAETHGLGGVILFDYNVQTKSYANNVESPEQVRALVEKIHALLSRPLVVVDQEGGKVRRLKEKLGFAPLPSAKTFNPLAAAEKRALVTRSFRELRDLGFDFDLAPVIDLDLNPANPDIGAVERSYSADPDEVRANFAIVNAAAREAGLGLSLKHFPGLGGATVNSHLELTDLSDSVSDAQLELFYELGREVSGASVLVSHGIVRQWEAGVPVSMSAAGVGRLRARLPDALLISDDLQMQGLQKILTSARACSVGIRAGLDVLCIGNNLMAEDEATLAMAAGLEREMSEDAVFRERANEAIARVRATKARFAR